MHTATCFKSSVFFFFAPQVLSWKHYCFLQKQSGFVLLFFFLYRRSCGALFLSCTARGSSWGKRGYQEHILHSATLQLLTFSVNSCNIPKLPQLGAKSVSLPSSCSFFWLPHALLLAADEARLAAYFFLFFVSE